MNILWNSWNIFWRENKNRNWILKTILLKNQQQKKNTKTVILNSYDTGKKININGNNIGIIEKYTIQ